MSFVKDGMLLFHSHGDWVLMRIAMQTTALTRLSYVLKVSQSHSRTFHAQHLVPSHTLLETANRRIVIHGNR